MEWKKGEEEDGSDSLAEQVAADKHWPGLRILILVVSIVYIQVKNSVF